MSIEDMEAKIRQWVEDIESGSDFSAGSEDDYIPSGDESDSETGVSKKARNEAPVTDDEELSGDSLATEKAPERHETRHWRESLSEFRPLYPICDRTKDAPANHVPKTATKFATFRKLFPYGAFVKIAQHTNERIKIHNDSWDSRQKTKQRRYKETDPGEIEIVIGCLLIMSYNRLPTMRSYWSDNPTLQNSFIKAAITRDRACYLLRRTMFRRW